MNIDNNLTTLSKMKPCHDVQIYHMPKAKFIGKQIINTLENNLAPSFWDRLIESGEIEKIKKIPAIIPNSIYGWSGEWVEETRSYSNLVGMLCAYEAEVPEGYVCKEVAETLIAVGEYGINFENTIKRMKEMGYKTDYQRPNCGWNGELYLDEEVEIPVPDEVKMEAIKNGSIFWRLLIPCVKE